MAITNFLDYVAYPNEDQREQILIDYFADLGSSPGPASGRETWEMSFSLVGPQFFSL